MRLLDRFGRVREPSITDPLADGLVERIGAAWQVMDVEMVPASDRLS